MIASACEYCTEASWHTIGTPATPVYDERTSMVNAVSLPNPTKELLRAGKVALGLQADEM